MSLRVHRAEDDWKREVYDHSPGYAPRATPKGRPILKQAWGGGQHLIHLQSVCAGVPVSDGDGQGKSRCMGPVPLGGCDACNVGPISFSKELGHRGRCTVGTAI